MLPLASSTADKQFGKVLRPERLAIPIILDDFSRIQVRDQNRSCRRQLRPAELAVDAIGVSRRQHKLVFNGAGGFVDDDEFRGIGIFDEHHAVGADGFRGVDFSARRRVKIPDHLLVQGDFGDAKLVGEKNVPVRLQHRFTDFAPAGMGIRPDDLAAPDDEQPFLPRFARVKEIMLREALAGQHGGRVRNGVGAGAETAHRGRRAEREEKGQFEKPHGLSVLIVSIPCYG